MAGLYVLLYLVAFYYSDSVVARRSESGEPPKGLFPTVFNLATNAIITVNATCGERGPENYCKLVEHDASMREPQCGVCDITSPLPDKRHSISNAIDGTSRWWQSPTLQNGKQYQWVTITLDLRQKYQVAYVIIKAAISPRPGNWILERSVDGVNYQPWQYYAISDTECWQAYGIRPTIGQPRYRSDNDVICTSHYSKLNPLEHGEIHTSLVNGRPGAVGQSDTLTEFTTARYIRIRLQKIRTLNADLMMLQTNDPERIDKTVTRRYFYSIKDISIGGHCVCFGHAKDCPRTPVKGKQQCVCEHNTCGENCNYCCPLFNQQPWRPGNATDGAACEECQCFGHSTRCHYDPNVANQKTSINIEGIYEGGGVCEDCQHNTTGINCEQCIDGFYRPRNVRQDDPSPCRRCQCREIGMTGLCVKDDSHISEGVKPGECFCKEGFTGKKCDRCAIGYRNYPLCEPCPCHFAGTVNGTCEGECICKVNVEGARCDRCKDGYYHLSADNPDGCSACFCFGVTNRCQPSDWGKRVVIRMEGWLVTSLDGRRIVYPNAHKKQFMIANDDMASYDNYYWLAPDDYIGKKLYSYGGELKLSISYIIARGDTSGHHTEYPDVILEGTNGELLGYSWGTHPEEDTVTITMPLREQGWYVLSKTGGRASPVSRETFTIVLNSIRRLLIRAKFHTDQVECTLKDVGLEIASETSVSLKNMTSVEKCICPPGYTGLSCELCSPGYRRINSTLPGGICERCDCHNHAQSCDPVTGRCQTCLHNTMGVKCEHCLPGYYGDARIGTPEDCKRCACPLEDPINNFSPTCRAILTASGTSEYVCLNCASGYEGDKCERCSEGYFGSPLVLGGYCQPCDCGRNVDTSHPVYCDRVTGQCLQCPGNTGGWNCGECREHYYGNAEQHNCIPCDCNRYGSLFDDCDKITGQCHCRPNYVGRKCDRCADHYGNIEIGCVPCWCSPVGARSESCDPVSGRCTCKPGVFGTRCESCLENHYGFSDEGCHPCDCNLFGSVSRQCDENSGQCRCRQHVIERTCSRCQPGYWNIASKNGCEQCVCNSTGIITPVCDERSGQCNCKPGVGGRHCDQCLPGYFGFTSRGCRKCDPCDAPGHSCDPKTGRCVCPPYTTGDRCQFCTPDAHGFDSENGCEPCNCSPSGSIDQKCDDVTGNCFCREGFEGRHCDRCKFGYYQFPHCQQCDCDMVGTNPDQCRMVKHGLKCQCDDRGNCPCKENVAGRNCNQCKENTFGMTANNSKGCFECFCFGRTKNCHQASLRWSKLSVPGIEVTFEIGDEEIPTFQGFKVIPGRSDYVIMHIPYVIDQPLYWSLPMELLGDKVSAYNGLIQYEIMSHSESHFPDALLRRFPSILLQGNHRLVLIHNVHGDRSTGRHAVRLHEDEWQHYENPQTPVTRAAMMVALQNLQLILIRGTNGADVKFARISDITLQVADESSFINDGPSEGIEICQCPPKYVGLSCQDPAPGYYRKYKENHINSKDILDLVGWAEPCDCNNRSRTCDKETGICINCTNNSIGPNCENCDRGFYEELYSKRCLPCSCPLTTNRFSDTCHPEGLDYICIDCQRGYAGRHCERCSDGYYGNPLVIGGTCEPCRCDPYGSQSQMCDNTTGQCPCLKGFVGRDCAECKEQRHILTEYGCRSCVDDCTGALFTDLDYINDLLNNLDLSNMSAIPWEHLRSLENQAKALRPPLDKYTLKVALGRQLVIDFTIHFDLENQADDLFRKSGDTAAKASLVAADAESILNQVKELLDGIQKLRKELSDLVNQLEMYGKDPSRPGSTIERLLAQAEGILKELRNRDFIPKVKLAQEELKKAQDLLRRVKGLKLDRDHLDDLRERLDMVELTLASVIRIIEEDVRQPINQALNINLGTRGALEEVQDTVDRTIKSADNAGKILKEANVILAKAKSAVIDAAVKYEGLPRLLRDLENATQELEQNNGILSRLNPLYKEKYVIPAQKHAYDLQRQVELYVRQFNATRVVSEFPLKAANAYQSIVDALDAAEKAAQEADDAAEVAYKEVYPVRGEREPLIEKARKAKEHSLGLLREAERLRDIEVPELEELLDRKRRILEQVGENLAQGQKNIVIIDRELAGLPQGIPRALERADDRRNSAVLTTIFANEQVDAINEKIAKELLPGLDAMKTGTIGGLENFTKIIEQAKVDIHDASKAADLAEDTAGRVERRHRYMQSNLTDLRDKILLARQKASSIRVSISADKKGHCRRSFKPEIEPTTTNNIVLNFAIKSESRDSLLFFLGSSKAPPETLPDDFMAIEMVNRKIRFLWNAGGGTQVIQHNLTIETNDQQFLKNEQWYKIEVQRSGNIAVLSVKCTPDGKGVDPHEVTGASPAGYSKMDLDSSSYFYIGGLPPGYKAPKELKSRSLAGCLYEVVLDGKPVGLWNFQTNEGCDGCKEGATEDIDVSAYRFKGDGYAVWPQIRRYNKESCDVFLWFKTFDENALLFMAPSVHNEDFMSLEIREGKVVYRVNLGGSSQLTISTTAKYNNGNWTEVVASRIDLLGRLVVNAENLEFQMQRGGPTSLDIQNSPLYYGGVPPNFTTSRWPGITFQNFLGCMKAVQIDATSVNLLKNPYGIEEGCLDRAIKVASFHGTGYLELKGQPLPQEASFGFSFLTHQKNALLLLSTFKGRNAPAEKENHYYSVAIVDGMLEVKVNSGSLDNHISSKVPVTDGKYHTITVIKKNRKIVIRIDDEEVGQLRLPRGVRGIEAPDDGGLYLGGIPQHIKLDQLASTRAAFIGIIKDAIFNNRLLAFNEPVDFIGVGIGRTSSVHSIATLEHAPMSDTRENCAPSDPHKIEKKAVHFGIHHESFSKISITKKEASPHFKMGFDFRTFQGDGLLLVSQHGRRKNYFALLIENGHLVADIQTKRALKKLISPTIVNDGQWHSISINFYKQVVYMTIDGNITEGRVNVNKLPIRSVIYIGGVPRDFTLNKKLNKEKFQGCVKSLVLAGKQKSLVENPSRGITACLANVEPGLYFTDGAYATFDSPLLFKRKSNIFIEFRTTQLSGGIIAITSGINSLLIYTEDGKVELLISADNSSEPIKLSHGFHSKYSICQNEWHTIVVDYSHGTISFKVDNMKTLEAKVRWLQHSNDKAKIFIGRHPDNHLLGFTGCIKNFKLNGMPVSWYEALSNKTLPCPAA